MLRGNSGSGQHGLQLRDVKPEDGRAECESDGGEQQQGLGLLVEGRWVLENAQAAGAEGGT